MTRQLVGREPARRTTGDERADAGAADRVDRYAALVQCLEHTDAGDTARATAAEHHADAPAEQETRDPVDVAVAIDAHVVVAIDGAVEQPPAGAAGISCVRRVHEHQFGAGAHRVAPSFDLALDRAYRGLFAGGADEQHEVGLAHAGCGPVVGLGLGGVDDGLEPELASPNHDASRSAPTRPTSPSAEAVSDAVTLLAAPVSRSSASPNRAANSVAAASPLSGTTAIVTTGLVGLPSRSDRTSLRTTWVVISRSASGNWATSFENASPESSSTWLSRSAVTSAERGSLVITASSPTTSPRPSSATSDLGAVVAWSSSRGAVRPRRGTTSRRLRPDA